MADEKILIIGASGAVGSCIYDYMIERVENIFGTFNTKTKPQNSNLFHLDLASRAVTKSIIQLLKPSIVIFCAGMKDVKKCQLNPMDSVKVNALSLDVLRDAVNSLDYSPLFIYLSTDYVFAGESGGYTFNDDCVPNTFYGFSKLLGENLTKKFFPNCLILRSSAIMTPGHGFFGWLNHAIKEKQPIQAFDNIFFSPTPISYLCEVILKYIYSNPNEEQFTLHCSSNIRVSRYDFISNYTLIAYPESQIILTPCSIDLNNSMFKRDLSICDGTKLKLQATDSLDFGVFCNA